MRTACEFSARRLHTSPSPIRFPNSAWEPMAVRARRVDEHFAGIPRALSDAIASASAARLLPMAVVATCSVTTDSALRPLQSNFARASRCVASRVDAACPALYTFFAQHRSKLHVIEKPSSLQHDSIPQTVLAPPGQRLSCCAARISRPSSPCLDLNPEVPSTNATYPNLVQLPASHPPLRRVSSFVFPFIL